MTTIILEVPDELAAQVAALRGRLPDLLAKALKSETAEKAAAEIARANGTETSAPLYREITDFLASNPLPEQIAAYKIPRAAQARLEDLLDKNREEGLTAAETAELDAYLQARDLMILLKASSRPELTS